MSSTTSLYIHWPFCKSKCPYCDFNSHVRDTPLAANEWQQAYLKELEHYAEFLDGKTITSIYFGGGTPSLMSPALVGILLEKVDKLASIAANIEITLEANPTSVELEKLQAFKDAGVNRISMGIQSLKAEHLRFLGREHSAKDALKALEIVASLFERYSFDLIYALPNQSLKQWETELKDAMQFMQSHASLYQLTIEKGTPFYGAYHKGEFTIPDEDLAADMYELTNAMMAAQGLEAYEVSNYAKAGHESQHNLNYWRYGDYIGIGAGAHGRISKDGKKIATQTIHHPENWLKYVLESGHGIQQQTPLTEQEMLEEILMFGLRLKEGIGLDRANEILHKPLLDSLNSGKLAYLKDSGVFRREDNQFALTDEGRMKVNELLYLLLG